ncbi:hypothetical protein BH09PSE4_BH09PSE4_11070 [soil metagenome]
MPARGKRALWALAAGFLLAAPGFAQRLPYPAIAPDLRVSPPPRLPYRALPIDDRIAPRDAAYDGDEETEQLSPQQAQALTDRVLAGRVVQNYAPSPAIWRIGDRDTTIYMFGTIHILPPGFRWRSPKLEAITREADSLLVESVDDGSDPNIFLGNVAGGPRLPPLSERVSPDHREALKRFMESVPPQAAAIIDGLPTWIASVAVTYVREVRAGETPGPGADAWLEEQFNAAHKPVEAIEDGAKVLASVSAIPAAEQRRMLDAALDAPAVDRDKAQAPTHAWARGQIGPDSPLVVDMAATSGSPALAGPLLDSRNKAWTDSLIQRLDTPGTILFAAGAGHFIGDTSVIALLQRRGIKVTRVE